MRPGDRIRVEARKWDGSLHRAWDNTLQAAEGNLWVLTAPAGRQIEDPRKGPWRARYDAVQRFWADRWYNWTELRRRGGAWAGEYIHIATPAVVRDGVLTYVDLELDVWWPAGEEPRVEDRDEFAVATAVCSYPANVVARAEAAVTEVLARIAARRGGVTEA